MATATKPMQNPLYATPPTFPELNATNEKLTALNKKVAGLYIDSYEKAGLSVADFQEEAAKAANLEWVEAAGTAQADLTRRLTTLSASAARDLLK